MDFDDLLEDSEPIGQHKLTNKKKWNDIASSKLKNVIKDDDLDLFDDDDLWQVSKKK